jgi:hypothetical protein
VHISNCVQNDDGSLDFNFHVNEEEAAFLMDFAIKSLIHQGIIKVTAESQEISLETFPDTEGGMQ